MTDRSTSLPHSTTKTFRYGASPESATHAVILIHGRGGAPPSIVIPLAPTLLFGPTESKLCILAPAAEDRVWYPARFSSRWSENEPWLNASVERIEREVQGLERCGIARERIMIGGFSQGACVAAKYALTYPAKYWGVFILSGALPGMFQYILGSFQGLEEYKNVDLQGTRVFVGCGDTDPLVRPRMVEWTGGVFAHFGAAVEKRVYEGLGHSINQDERNVLRAWVSEMISAE